jgi:nitrogen fixation protein FixH
MPTSPSPQASRWPSAIITVFVLFAGYIGYMVQQALRTSVDLVSPDYYQQELVYQQRMETVARTAALPAPVELTYHAEAQELRLQLPAALAGQALQGQMHFFRPSDQKLDFVLPLLPTAGQQRISTAAMQPGYWRVRLDFTASKQPYFIEQEVVVK